MRYLLSTCVLLVASVCAFATPPKLDIPDKIKPVNGYVVVKPETDAVSIVYISLDTLTPFPSELLKDPLSLVVPTRGEPAGTYRFIAVGASKDGDQKRVDFSVVIDGPPVPPDPFLQALNAAWEKETGADKAKQIATLASLYKMAATTTVNDQSVKTIGDLFADMKAASTTLLPADALTQVRKVVGDRLSKSVGNSASTPIDRKLVAAEFNAIAAALGGLK